MPTPFPFTVHQQRGSIYREITRPHRIPVMRLRRLHAAYLAKFGPDQLSTFAWLARYMRARCIRGCMRARCMRGCVRARFMPGGQFKDPVTIPQAIEARHENRLLIMAIRMSQTHERP